MAIEINTSGDDEIGATDAGVEADGIEDGGVLKAGT